MNVYKQHKLQIYAHNSFLIKCLKLSPHLSSSRAAAAAGQRLASLGQDSSRYRTQNCARALQVHTRAGR